MKSCSRCKVSKSLDCFHRDCGAKDGRASCCKKCLGVQIWGWALSKKYGLNPSTYQQLLIKQNSACAICKVPASNLPKRLSVDHNHQTKTVRGLLCLKCNTLLGNADDSAKRLVDAISYLQNPPTYSPS